MAKDGYGGASQTEELGGLWQEAMRESAAGFEPAVPGWVHLFSRQVASAAHPPLRFEMDSRGVRSEAQEEKSQRRATLV